MAPVRASAGLLAVGLGCLVPCGAESAGKKEVEVVLAQYNEDIAWSDPFADLRTVYCKGSGCSDGAIHLPNVGREGHTFLKHIVDRYDSLADWTVFSQAEAPTDGYFGAGHEKRGHMLGGVSFMDYLTPSPDTGMKFYLTSQVHVPTLRHSLRSTFQVSPDQVLPGASEARGTCPVTDADKWNSFEDMPELRKFLSSKCGLEEWVLADAIRMFWDEYLEAELPAGEIVQYAQGARFALSRETILARPKAFYTKLLEALSTESDPCANYIMEWAWYYVFAPADHSTPCKLSQDIIDSTQTAGVRSLQEGGVSGRTTTTAAPTPAPAPAPVIVYKKQTKVASTASLSVADPEGTCKNQAFIDAFCDGLEDVLGTRPDCACEVGAAARRLDDSVRRLAGTVDMLYSITIEEEVDEEGNSLDATASASNAALLTDLETKITAASTDPTALTTALTSAMTKAAVDIVVTVASVSAPQKTEVSVTMTQTVTSSTMTMTATTVTDTTTAWNATEGITRMRGTITVEVSNDTFSNTTALASNAEAGIIDALDLDSSATVTVTATQDSSGRRLAASYTLSYVIELQDATYELATTVRAKLTSGSSGATEFLAAFSAYLSTALGETIAATELTTPTINAWPEQSSDDGSESDSSNVQLGGGAALAASVILALLH